MAIIKYTEQDEYDLVHSGQDCIGWTVTDQSGHEFGKVTEMLINTETEMVDSVIVEGGARIPARDFEQRDHKVVVRGVFDAGQYEQTRSVAATGDYDATSGDGAGYVSGVTRGAAEGEEVLPIVEEQLRVGKRTVESGGARVRTNIEEVPVSEQVNLREEHLHVERRTVDRPASEADFTAFKEGEIEIAEYAEVPVVAKEARVVEEIGIGKEVSERAEVISETVKRTDVEVDRVESDVDNTRRATNN